MISSSTTSSARLAIALLIAALVSIAVACGGDDTSTVGPSVTQLTLASGTAGASETDDADQPAGTQGAISDGFPEDFPIYPVVEPLRGADFGDRFTAEWRSTDPVTEVIAFYSNALSIAPWETTGLDDSATDAAVFDFVNEQQGYSGVLGVGAIPAGGSRIILNLEVEQ